MNRLNGKNRFYGVAALLSASAFTPPAHAGGVHDITLNSIPLARTPIVVDGNLSDWPDTRPAPFVPIDAGLDSSSSPALAQLRRQHNSATLQAAYDAKALYIGLVWNGLTPGKAASVVLHIKTDRVTHLRIAPLLAGKPQGVQERMDDQPNCQNASGATSVTGVPLDGAVTQEIRIPWSQLSQSAKPATSLTLAADLEWPDLTQPFIQQLPTEVLHGNTHLTACFLTSPARLFGRDQYLGNPNDWGTLNFMDGPHANATQESTLASGATETFVSLVQTPVKVDGQLGEWNPTQFQSVTYAPGFLGDRYNMKIAASYDANFLYVAAHAKSPDGPFNSKPEATQAGYAGGDCLQLRLNNGKTTVNLGAWFDSVNKKPALTVDNHDLPNPYLLSQGAQEAFKSDADGQGYSQELAIPWKVLPSGTAPKAGDTWKGTFQVWWAGLNPQFTVIANASLAQGGGIPVTYTLAKEANVTLGVFDGEGHLVQSLVKDARRRAGRNTDYWDGKDQFGNLVSAGKYQVRGLDHPPIETQHVISIGNPGTPPWPTADGKGDWLSDEATAQGAVTDGNNVYLAAPGSEKGNAIMAVGPDGKRLWGFQMSSSPRCVSLALQGQYLYALFSGPESVHATPGTNEPDKIGRAFIICLDKNTGAAALFSTQKTEFRVASWPFVDRVAGLWDLRKNKTFTPANYEGQPRYSANDVGEPTEAVGIAAIGGRLYVSMLTQNQILVLDGTTGKQIDTIPLTQPVGLHALPSGNILGISDGKVVTINPATKAVTTTLDHDLVAPHDVTTDKSGNIYVSDWGNSFQVKVFSAKGQLLRAIGTRGGRPWLGKWDANGMLLPRGVAVTDDGKLWVAEDDGSPNRVSVWNASTGALLRDYIGPSPYGGGGHFWADPTDAATILAQGTLFHVDYAKKTWTPISTPFRRMSMNEAFTPNGMNGMPGARTVTHGGKQYVYVNNGGYSMVVFRHDGDLLRPMAAFGSLGRFITTDGTTLTVWDSDIGYHNLPNYYPAFFKGHNGDNYIWTDNNGDGEVQPNEMQWARSLARGDQYQVGMTPEATAGWGFGAGADGAVYLGGETKGKYIVSRLDVQSWAPNGVPLYDLAKIQPIVVGSEGIQGLYADAKGQVYVTHGYEWGGSKHALDVYDRDGKPLWSFGAPLKRQQPDDFLADNVISEFHVAGETVLASWLWHANFKPYLFTSDGLLISNLLDDTRLGPTSTWDESYKHFFQAPDGTPYIVNGANDAFHINKIVGLGQLYRFSSSLTVSQADLDAATAAANQAATAPVAAPRPTIHVTALNTPPTIDGDLSEWNMNTGVALNGSKNRSARVALGRDATNLYLAYEVHGSKLINKGANPQTLFISGDAVDLMLHTGPFKTHFSPEAGDERLLISLYQGKPAAVLYRPVVTGATTSTRLMGANIAQITRLSSVHIAFKRSGDGYTLEASVPLSDLGLNPSETQTLRGDVGVIYADETGANRSIRLYYYNHDTDMTADLTTEATLQPGNWGDVEFPLGPNLLKNGDFEEPLATTPDQGWAVTTTRNAGTASISGDAAFSGAHSLLLQQTAPITYAPESYNLPDYGAFINSGNGGTGGGYIEVRQRVPVTAGKKYSLRFHLRTLDFPGGENKNPGPNRGYVSLQTWLSWEGAPGGNWVTNQQDTLPEWKTLKDARFNYYGVAVPYIAPAGATSAIVQFGLSDNFAARLPKAYIDGVELVEVP